MESSDGIAPVPRASATNRGGRKGPGLTMAIGWADKGWRPAALLGPQGLCLGGTPILRGNQRRKDESGTTRGAPKGATPVFPDIPVFLVPQISLLPGFDNLTVFCLRGTKNTDYALLRPFYGLVTQNISYFIYKRKTNFS